MSVHSSLYMGGSFLRILFLGILVERSANLAAVVREHERCLDHVREPRLSRTKRWRAAGGG